MLLFECSVLEMAEGVTVLEGVGSGSVADEVLASAPLGEYLKGLEAVFSIGTACSSSLAALGHGSCPGHGNVPIVEMEKEFRRRWGDIRRLARFEGDGGAANGNGNDLSAGKCELCLAVGGERVEDGGGRYHARCLNLWLNRVNDAPPKSCDAPAWFLRATASVQR